MAQTWQDKAENQLDGGPRMPVRTQQPGAETSSPLSVALSARDRTMIDTVRAALRKDRVLLAFQPVIQPSASEKPVFYEAFLRVLDPRGRPIPASEFMHAAERQEMGRELDTLALARGLGSLEQVPELRLSINMSAHSIAYPPWRRALDTALRRDQTLGERLILEITEDSANAMPDIVQVFMREMHLRGVSFALDNFGAGFTSLKYLRDFYFDILKIDGTLVQDIHQKPDNRVLVKAILSLAHHFEMFTVAQNVEKRPDAELLARLGIDCLQGYCCGAPTLSPIWKDHDGAQSA